MSATVRVHRLSLGARLFLGSFAVFFPVVMAGYLVGTLTEPNSSTERVFLLAWAGFVLLVGAFTLWLHRPLVTSVELHPDGRVVFRGLLGRREVWVRDLVRVRASVLDIFQMYPVFHTTRGKVRLLLRVERSHDLLAALQSANASFRIEI